MAISDQASAEFTRLCRELTRDWRTALDRRLRPYGLTHVQWLTLTQLAQSESAPTQVELAGRLGVEGPSMVRLLDRMEARGLVAREADPVDRRRKIIQLSETARGLMQAVESVGRGLRRDFLAEVSAEELAGCIAVLAKIRRNQDAALAADAITNKGDTVKVADQGVRYEPARRSRAPAA